jgi:hypothetical protein
VIISNIIEDYTGTNVEASVVQQTRTLTPDEIRTYTFGSQEQLAAWYSYTALIVGSPVYYHVLFTKRRFIIQILDGRLLTITFSGA